MAEALTQLVIVDPKIYNNYVSAIELLSSQHLQQPFFDVILPFTAALLQKNLNTTDIAKYYWD